MACSFFLPTVLTTSKFVLLARDQQYPIPRSNQEPPVGLGSTQAVTLDSDRRLSFPRHILQRRNALSPDEMVPINVLSSVHRAPLTELPVVS